MNSKFEFKKFSFFLFWKIPIFFRFRKIVGFFFEKSVWENFWTRKNIFFLSAKKFEIFVESQNTWKPRKSQFSAQSSHKRKQRTIKTSKRYTNKLFFGGAFIWVINLAGSRAGGGQLSKFDTPTGRWVHPNSCKNISSASKFINIFIYGLVLLARLLSNPSWEGEGDGHL